MIVKVTEVDDKGDLRCEVISGKPELFPSWLYVDPFVGKAIDHCDKQALIGKTFEMEDNPQPYLVLPMMFEEVPEDSQP